jgi:hypothetical protein
MPRRSAWAGAAFAAVTVLAAGACTGSSGADQRATPDRPEQLTWTPEQTIPDVRPGGITTDPTTGLTYVGGSLPAGSTSSYSGPLIKGGTRKPVLWVRSADGTWAQARLKVTSFYGAQATLASLSAYRRVIGLGAVAGGAHANPRPSFFVGDSTTLAEHEQNFYVFGGENAVGIVSVAAGPQALLMVGQWAPDGHRASGALWTAADGLVFVRHDEIPGLGDSLGGQRTTSPQAAAAIGERFVVVGSVTDLSKPTLSIEPAVWLSGDGTSVTAGSLTPTAGHLGGPSAVACAAKPELAGGGATAGTCLTAGLLTVSGKEHLAAWRIDVADTAKGQPLDVSGCPSPAPAPDAGESTARPPRVRVSIGPDGRGWIVAATSRAGIACRVDGGTVRPVTVPAGCIPLAVQAPGQSSTAGDAQPGQPVLVCADAVGVTTYRQH